MNLHHAIRNFWEFLKKDTWPSWIVSIILVVILIKFVIFPFLSLVTGTSLPLVVVESCSMYHESSFEDWWSSNEQWYNSRNISKSKFELFPLKNGLNKGDIVLVWGYTSYAKGDIIIFESETKYPIIHRIISLEPLSTKGDHNYDQIEGVENDIQKKQVIGKAIGKIPGLGWIKLIFFEPFRKQGKGFCR